MQHPCATLAARVPDLNEQTLQLGSTPYNGPVDSFASAPFCLTADQCPPYQQQTQQCPPRTHIATIKLPGNAGFIPWAQGARPRAGP